MDSTHPCPLFSAAFDVLAAALNERPHVRSRAPRDPNISEFLPLIPERGLFVRVRSDAVLAGYVFQRAFCRVWSRIPEIDRRRLVDYWHDEARSVSADYGEPSPRYMPQIQLTDTWSPICERRGFFLGNSKPSCSPTHRSKKLPAVVKYHLKSSKPITRTSSMSVRFSTTETGS